MMTPLKEPPTKSRRTSGEFVESAVLEAVIPTSSDLDLDQLFQEWDGELSIEVSSVVPFIEQRQFLLLDELVTVYIVLRTPSLGEKDLKVHLSRLAITVEAHALGQQVIKQGDGSQPPQIREAKELLATETVSVSDDPMICATEIQAEGDSEPSQYIYIFWKAVVPIGRPKGRLQKLAVFFTPTAVLKPFPISGALANGSEVYDDYLPSNSPLSMNVLAPLANDPSLGTVAPFLSASRFSKSPNNSSKQQPLARPIRGGPRKLFRAAPAFLWRIRFLRYPALAEKDAMFACFDLEVTQFASSPVSLDKITLNLSSGHAEGVGVQLPLLSNAGEQTTLIYKLNPPSDSSTRFGVEANFGSSADPLAGRTLAVTLSASVLLSEECIPKVKIKWKTALEMPTSRPTSRADAGQPPAWSHNFGINSRLGHDSLLMTGQIREVDVGPPIPNGVSISITAPEKVLVGKLFRWEVLVINRSEQIQRFAIVPIPRRKTLGDGGRRGSTTTVRPTSRGSTGGGKLSSIKNDVASPLVDENVLFSLQKSSVMEASELICLSPDVRIGSLGPSACYAADLQFVALSSGVLHLEALRLIDMATQHTVDIRQLPDIVASFGGDDE